MYDGSDFLAAIVCTVLAWWLIRHWLIAQMSNVHEASEAGEYLERGSVNITAKNHAYLYTNTERHPKKKK